MTTLGLADLQAAAAADLWPIPSIPGEIPNGSSPEDQTVTGYVKAAHTVTQAADLDCNACWGRRQRFYAAEIAWLQTDGGTADPAMADQLDAEWDRATLNARASSRTETLGRMAAAVDKINGLTQRLIDEHRPGDSVYEFLSARTLDTTVSPY